jgi:hypothetical protein
VLLSIVAAHLFLLLGLHVVLLRYILPLITLSWLWVAKGIDEIAQWAVQTAKEAVSPRVSRVRWLDVGVRGALVAALLLSALWGLRWGSPFEDLGPRAALLKDVGTWLDHYRPGPKRVMTTHAEIAYYSKGTLLLLPYAESSDVLRYVHLKRPDFIIIETDGTVAPYLRQWSDQGIPDQAATLIYRADGFTIYEWQG